MIQSRSNFIPSGSCVDPIWIMRSSNPDQISSNLDNMLIQSGSCVHPIQIIFHCAAIIFWRNDCAVGTKNDNSGTNSVIALRYPVIALRFIPTFVPIPYPLTPIPSPTLWLSSVHRRRSRMSPQGAYHVIRCKFKNGLRTALLFHGAEDRGNALSFRLGQLEFVEKIGE